MHSRYLDNPQPGEKLVLVLRRHWFVALGVVVVALILLTIPIALYFALQALAPQLLDHTIITPILSILASVYVLSVWLFAFTDFLDYYLDVWVITTDRLINIEQHGLFKRTSSELNLSSIQDVTSEIEGPVQTFFRYGNVYVQTAAERERFVLKKIPGAEAVQESIIHLAEQDRLKEEGS